MNRTVHIGQHTGEYGSYGPYITQYTRISGPCGPYLAQQWYQKVWIVRSIYGSTFEKIVENWKIQKFVENSKNFKWPYLPFPCVKNPNSGKNPNISKIEQKSKKLAEGHQASSRITPENVCGRQVGCGEAELRQYGAVGHPWLQRAVARDRT